MPNCPRCHSNSVIKNGHIHNGKQNHKCRICGRQFVQKPQQKRISQETKALIDKLLLEKIPLAGIARVTPVSEVWLQDYANQTYQTVPHRVDIERKKGRLTIQCDEMWSFVGHKGNKQWIWLALDVDSHAIVGLHVGSRDRHGARQLWHAMPPVYRQCAVCYTDFWEAYQRVIPSKRHRPVGKHTGQTNAIERFNCTMRQRVSRLVRKTLSFSKKVENHIGAIWLFVHHYNQTLLA